VFNAQHTIESIEQAVEQHASIVLFPELGLSAYSCDDLFITRAPWTASYAGLEAVLHASQHLADPDGLWIAIQLEHVCSTVSVVHQAGFSLGTEDVLAELSASSMRRSQFASGDVARHTEVEVCGQRVPIRASQLLFQPAISRADAACRNL